MSIQFGPEWRDFENRLARYPQVTEVNLRRALNASLLLIEADAKQNVRQDTRRLAGSINHRIDGDYPNLIGRVGPSVNYGAAVEFGRRAGAKMPPADALMGWVRRHWAPSAAAEARIRAARFGGPRRARSWRAAGQDALRARAWVLARAIKRRADSGDRGARPYLVPAYRRNQAAIEAMFARIGVRITSYLSGGPL